MFLPCLAVYGNIEFVLDLLHFNVASWKYNVKMAFSLLSYLFTMLFKDKSEFVTFN